MPFQFEPGFRHLFTTGKTLFVARDNQPQQATFLLPQRFAACLRFQRSMPGNCLEMCLFLDKGCGNMKNLRFPLRIVDAETMGSGDEERIC